MIISQVFPQIIASVCCLGLIFSIPVRQSSLLKKAGKCILPLRRGKVFKAISIFVLCFIIIFVTLVRSINYRGVCIICAACVAASELAVRNFLLLKNSGVFENGIYIQHPFILYKEIKSVPALLWEDADISDKLDYQIVMSNSANVNIIFQDKEEAETVLNYIKKNCPEVTQN